MESTGITRKLQEAAMEGNVTDMLALLQQDPLLLDRIFLVDDPPLHVAALLGHSDFAAQILQRKPRLAKEVDSLGFSPLHLAAAKGHLELVRLLLQVEVDHTDLCLLLDADGRNPLHLAAMFGRVDCLRELIGARPEAARVLVDHGGTILHLCVKKNQLESLKVLIEAMDDDIIFLNAKDDYGFTILHLAVSNKQIQMVEYLVSINGIEVNAANSNGYTALDILIRSKRPPKDLDIAELLRAYGAIRSTNGNQNSNTTNGSRLLPPPNSENQTSGSNRLVAQRAQRWKFLESDREALMVVATVIATMAFQASISPPGGPWQSDEHKSIPIQIAGKSIMATKEPDRYSKFIMNCTVSFILSIIEFFLLLTGFPSKRSEFWLVLYFIIGGAIVSIGLAYWNAIKFLTSGTQVGTEQIIVEVIVTLILTCVSICILLLIITIKVIKRLRRQSS